MLYACVVYIFSEPIDLGMGLSALTYILSLILTLGIMVLYWETGKKQKRNLDPSDKLLNHQLPIGTCASHN